MPSIEIPFEVDKPCFRITHSMMHDTEECPDCLGTAVVTVTFANGHSASVACENCKHGFEGSNGRVNTYIPQYIAIEWTPKKVYGFEDGEVKYTDWISGGGSIYSSKDMFANKYDALAEVAKRNVKAREAHKKNIFLCEVEKVKKYAWSASYHRSQIAELQKSISHHEQRLSEIDLKKGKKHD